MALVVQLLAGLVFGIGLVVSGMANPAKVLNFLDLAGTWDPSLAFVMGGAVAVALIGYRLVMSRSRPFCAPAFDLPAKTAIDHRIILGPAVFGIGWGLAGFCPGPALTSLALAAPGTLMFVPAMFAGMAIARWLGTRSA